MLNSYIKIDIQYDEEQNGIKLITVIDNKNPNSQHSDFANSVKDQVENLLKTNFSNEYKEALNDLNTDYGIFNSDNLLAYCEENQGKWMITAFNLGIRNGEETFLSIIEKVKSGEIKSMEDLKKYRMVS